MIVEGLTGFAMGIIDLIFMGFNAISLPVDLISVLVDILKFGAWVMGGDLLAIVFGSVIFWLSFKFTAGLILFIYRLLPLT